MPRPLLIFSQSDYLIQIIDTNSNTEWQTVQIQKPTDLDLHCLQRQGIFGSAGLGLKYMQPIFLVFMIFHDISVWHPAKEIHWYDTFDLLMERSCFVCFRYLIFGLLRYLSFVLTYSPEQFVQTQIRCCSTGYLYRSTLFATKPAFLTHWHAEKQIYSNFRNYVKLSRLQIDDVFLIFSRKQDLTFHANCFQWRQFAWNPVFWEK